MSQIDQLIDARENRMHILFSGFHLGEWFCAQHFSPIALYDIVDDTELINFWCLRMQRELEMMDLSAMKMTLRLRPETRPCCLIHPATLTRIVEDFQGWMLGRVVSRRLHDEC